MPVRVITGKGGMMTPSKFSKLSTMGSIANRYEAEVIASNIMKILARTGDTFRALSWYEYRTERENDGNFSTKEKQYFDDVIHYCTNPYGAARFCPAWAQAAIDAAKVE